MKTKILPNQGFLTKTHSALDCALSGKDFCEVTTSNKNGCKVSTPPANFIGKNGEASDNLDASKRASFLFCMKPTPPTSDFVLLDARYWNW